MQTAGWYSCDLRINSYTSEDRRKYIMELRKEKLKYYEQNGLIKTLNTMSQKEIEKIEKQYNCKIKR